MPLKRSIDTAAPPAVALRDYPRDLAGLLAQLQDVDPAVRRWAARDLAAEPRAAAGICARLACEDDASVRAVLFTTAARLGGAEVVTAMVALLRSDDPALRNGAIEVLAGLPDAVAPYVDLLLHDADGDVRIFTVNLLADLRHPKVPQWLDQVLLHDPAVNVVGAALDIAAELGSARTLPALREARRRFAGDAYIAFAVDLACARIESA